MNKKILTRRCLLISLNCQGPSQTKEHLVTTSGSADNACKTPQKDNPSNATLTKPSEPEKTLFCRCNQEDPSLQNFWSISKSRISSQLSFVGEFCRILRSMVFLHDPIFICDRGPMAPEIKSRMNTGDYFTENKILD